MTNKNGLFIVFEGGEGSGKSTQAKKLYEALVKLNLPVELTQEPGGKIGVGRQIRHILLERSRPGVPPLDPMAELMLFAANRAEHMTKVVLPALDENKIVVCDRFAASTIAYQGYGRQLDLEVVSTVTDASAKYIDPDVTYFLDVPPVVGLERSKKVTRNRFEDEDIEFHTRVRQGFLAQMDNSWVNFDTYAESADDVHIHIFAHAFGLVRKRGYIE